jgi:hypothetical protein
LPQVAGARNAERGFNERLFAAHVASKFVATKPQL